MGSGRLARVCDVPRIVDMIEALATSVNGPQKPDRLTTSNSVISHMMDPDGVVYVTNGGFISGRIIQTVISPEPAAFETGWYASDKSGLLLLRMFEHWAQDRQAAMIAMSCNGGTAQRILERCGYEVSEIHMVKRWQSLRQ